MYLQIYGVKYLAFERLVSPIVSKKLKGSQSSCVEFLPPEMIDEVYKLKILTNLFHYRLAHIHEGRLGDHHVQM